MLDAIVAVVIIASVMLAILAFIWLGRGAHVDLEPVKPEITVVRMFWCPVVDDNVTAQFQEELHGRRLAVTRCSAFGPPTRLTCSRQCVQTATLLPPAAGRRTA